MVVRAGVGCTKDVDQLANCSWCPSWLLQNPSVLLFERVTFWRMFYCRLMCAGAFNVILMGAAGEALFLHDLCFQWNKFKAIIHLFIFSVYAVK